MRYLVTPKIFAGQVVAGAHPRPLIGTGRQDNTGIKFDGLRRFQRDLGDFFERHRIQSNLLETSTPELVQRSINRGYLSEWTTGPLDH